MATNEPPNVTYRFVITATIDGQTAPLSIEGTSINEIRRAVRLLDANGMLTSQPASSGKQERVSTCRSCGAEIVWREKNGQRHPYDVVNGTPTEQSHFRSCPDAAQWRTKRDAA